MCFGWNSCSRGPSARRAPPLPDDDEDLSFMAAMSAFIAVTSDVSVSMAFRRSARVGCWGSVMLIEAAETGDDGEVGLWWALAAVAVEAWLEAAGEDRREPDTRLSRAW